MKLTEVERARFDAKIQAADGTGCCVWGAAKDKDGYAVVKVRGKVYRASRLLYMVEVGPIPDGYQVDHTCRNRACVNLAHLEAVTRLENVRRSQVNNHYRNKTHCPQGHPYSGDNLMVRPNGNRRCRTCNNAR